MLVVSFNKNIKKICNNFLGDFPSKKKKKNLGGYICIKTKINGKT